MGKKIVILGAGLAGLCAAYELQQEKHEITILEARAFPGGRVQTIRKPFAEGQYVEAGAIFVPEIHDHTMHYVQLFGLTLIPTPEVPAFPVYHTRGKRVVFDDSGSTWPFDLPEEERRLKPGDLLRRYAGRFINELEGIGSKKHWPPDSLKRFDQLTFLEFLRQQGASEEAICLLRTEYIEEWGEGIGSYSALSGLHDLARGHSGRFYRIQGGTDLLAGAFAQRVGSILYNAEVVKIEQNDRGVSVHFNKDGAKHIFQADFAICTIPFSVLKEIETPAFSTSKQEVIKSVPYTSVSRIYAQMKSRFWEQQGLSGAAYTDLPIMTVFHSTAVQGGRRGILEAYTSGPQARTIALMDEPERLQLFLSEGAKLFPQIKDHFEVGTTKCWDEDRWARGAYSWFKPGQMTTLFPRVIEPEGRVHFAGDHTSLLPGWMQGALGSGIRAAGEVRRATTTD